MVNQPITLHKGDFVLIPAAHDFTSSSTEPAPFDDIDRAPIEVRPDVFRLGDPDADPEVRMLIGYCAFASTDAVSKNGCLLIDLPVRGGDGTIDEKEEAILDDIGAWTARRYTKFRPCAAP